MPTLDCLEHLPGRGVTSSIIWMHGLGATSSDFVPLIPLLELPTTRFVFPQAPTRPVTINGGQPIPAWYDILTVERGPNRESPLHIKEAHAQIKTLIEREIHRGVPSERILLAGFSQGAAMTLYTGLRYTRPLAGLMVLSGYFILSDKLHAEASDQNRTTPLLMMHGRRDNVVPIELGKEAFASLQAGRRSEWRDYPMAHELCGAQIQHIREWLHATLSST